MIRIGKEVGGNKNIGRNINENKNKQNAGRPLFISTYYHNWLVNAY